MSNLINIVDLDISCAEFSAEKCIGLAAPMLTNVDDQSGADEDYGCY